MSTMSMLMSAVFPPTWGAAPHVQSPQGLSPQAVRIEDIQPAPACHFSRKGLGERRGVRRSRPGGVDQNGARASSGDFPLAYHAARAVEQRKWEADDIGARNTSSSSRYVRAEFLFRRFRQTERIVIHYLGAEARTFFRHLPADGAASDHPTVLP
jgi:hypothetical protein